MKTSLILRSFLCCVAFGVIPPLTNPRALAFQAPATAKAPPTLREGATGDAVEALQRALNARLDPSPMLDVDGDFGPATKAALVRFQKARKLPETGVADNATWEALGPPPRASTPEPPKPEPLPAKLPPDPLGGPPFVSVKAWAVVDAKTGALLGGKDESKPLDNASTTKLMTALVVMQLARKQPSALDETVIFSERADKTVGSTSAIKAGERLPVRELLYGLLLPSGNDASVAFAEHFGEKLAASGGSDAHARFIAEMNRLARELGLQETHFANPHGLTAAGHQASARDLAILARQVLADPILAEVVSTRRHVGTVVDAEGQKRTLIWNNTNRLLGTEGYDGVKTGSTSAAGSCLVASGRRGDEHLIVVALGGASSDSRDADVRNLFRWAWLRRGHTPR